MHHRTQIDENLRSMEEKNYPIFEDDATTMCCEPTVGYAATGSGYANTVVEDEEDVPSIPAGRLGFYTEDLDVFEARVAEIEADLDEVEAGYEDSRKWVTSSQFNHELNKLFPWLQ